MEELARSYCSWFLFKKMLMLKPKGKLSSVHLFDYFNILFYLNFPIDNKTELLSPGLKSFIARNRLVSMSSGFV